MINVMSKYTLLVHTLAECYVNVMVPIPRIGPSHVATESRPVTASTPLEQP